MSGTAEKVTVDNFVRAETDRMLKRYVDQGALGRFLHIRQPTPIDKQDVIRMNRDTLYSLLVADLTAPVMIVKPDAGGRFQSLMVVSEDHYALPVEHGAGEFTFSQDDVGTRYAAVIVRTFADADDADDVAAANALQDRLEVRQASPGAFEVPAWDVESLMKVHDALNVLASTMADFSGAFGTKSQVDPIRHLLGTAAGWGGNPVNAAMYVNVTPERNDGVTPHVVTVSDVPVDGFWSVTVYNSDGFIEANEYGAYSYNNVTAAKDADGTISIHFGGDPEASNYLPITPGWGYVVRFYQPRRELLEGTWNFPEAKVSGS